VESQGSLRVCVAGISHQTAPVSTRECVAFDRGEAVVFAADLLAAGVAVEALTLSTCNRTEVYLYTGDPASARRHVTSRLSASPAASSANVEASLYWHTGDAAMAHLLRVVSGLDSLILGEDQIVAQVRGAYRDAREAGVTGVVFNRLFSHALSTGKRVRAMTNLGGRRRSASLAAVELTQRLIGDLPGCSAVVVGTGETSELTGRHLREHGVRRILVAGRSLDPARDLADRIGGTACSLDGIDELLDEADVVISSTAAPHPLITSAQIRRAMARRAARRVSDASAKLDLLLVDLAVPRDIDPEAALTPGVTLVTIDDLLEVLVGNDNGEADQASPVVHPVGERPARIIEEELGRLNDWLRGLAVKPTLVQLRQHLEELRRRELVRFEPRLGELSSAQLAIVDVLTQSIVKKILHEPTVRLKALAGRPGGYCYSDAVRELFGLAVSADDDTVPNRPDSLSWTS